ncbi:hypothetical protein PSPO01_16124 [Paraphaeosphaeria sporulosa]
MFHPLVFYLWKSFLFAALARTTLAWPGYENVTSGIIRTYYVAAVEEEWDYMPSDMDMINGMLVQDSPQAAAFGTRNGQRESFISRIPGRIVHAAGPKARGDTVKVVFKNMASHNHTMHPHGFRYAKPSEGLAAAGQEFDGNSVAPGSTWTYTWEVPERAGPGPLDPPSLAWTYHSDVAGQQDVNSGLVGASIVYRPGELAKHTLNVPAPAGSNLTEEVLTLFLIVDENLSYYIDENTLNKTSIMERELQVT